MGRDFGSRPAMPQRLKGFPGLCAEQMQVCEGMADDANIRDFALERFNRLDDKLDRVLSEVAEVRTRLTSLEKGHGVGGLYRPRWPGARPIESGGGCLKK